MKTIIMNVILLISTVVLVSPVYADQQVTDTNVQDIHFTLIHEETKGTNHSTDKPGNKPEDKPDTSHDNGKDTTYNTPVKGDHGSQQQGNRKGWLPQTSDWYNGVLTFLGVLFIGSGILSYWYRKGKV